MGNTLRRTFQLGLLAKDLVAVRTSSPGPKRAKARQQLVERLGLMHGLPQKIGQLLAFSEIESSDPAFTKLTENEPELSAAEAVAEITRLLGGPLEEYFSTFEPIGIAASIGQVHRATMPDGRTVAVKLQLPGIADAVAHDLRALGWLTAPVGDLRRGFDLTAYRAEIGESLRRELDYREEAAALIRFAALTRSLKRRVVVPEVIPELSGEHLLVTTWLPGEHLGATRSWPQAARAELSSSLIELFFRGVLDWGVIHADPHPGNYRFLHVAGRPTVGLLDFGCTKHVPPGIQSGIRGLVADALGWGGTRPPDGLVWSPQEKTRPEAGFHLSDQAAGNAKLDSSTPARSDAHTRFTQMGFNPAVLEKLSARLPAVAAAIMAPFAAPGAFDVASWNLRDRLSEALGEDRMSFRTAGPPEMIFILRAFSGLQHYLKILDAPVDWREASGVAAGLRACGIGGYALCVSDTRLAETPAATPIENRKTEIQNHAAFMLSETLHIHVKENGATKVSLTFGAGATDHLPDLVPQEMRGRLAERAIDLAVIATAARAGSYAPGELFSLVDGAKTVRVWLA